jgi:hypothetical protein
METTKSIQRLAWRFSQGKAFLPNENDTDALNGIITFYNKQQEQINFSQEPFAKMYLYLYKNLVCKKLYDDNQFAISQVLRDVLNVPIANHIADIKFEMEGLRIAKEVAKETLNPQSILSIDIDHGKINSFLIAQINQILTDYEQTQ